jgi:hypothetical protein
MDQMSIDGFAGDLSVKTSGDIYFGLPKIIHFYPPESDQCYSYKKCPKFQNHRL